MRCPLMTRRRLPRSALWWLRRATRWKLVAQFRGQKLSASCASHGGDFSMSSLRPRLSAICFTYLESIRRVEAAIDRLALAERGDVRPLADSPGEYRLRVGDVRVRFAIDRTRSAIVVLRILPRG